MRWDSAVYGSVDLATSRSLRYVDTSSISRVTVPDPFTSGSPCQLLWQILRHVGDYIHHGRDRGGRFRHFLGIDSIDGVGGRVVNGEVSRRITAVGHHRHLAERGNRADVGAAAAGDDVLHSNR